MACWVVKVDGFEGCELGLCLAGEDELGWSPGGSELFGEDVEEFCVVLDGVFLVDGVVGLEPGVVWLAGGEGEEYSFCLYAICDRLVGTVVWSVS